MPQGTLSILGTDGQVEQDINAVIQANKTTRFIVRNIAKDYKTINIFGYPIIAGHTRDLLSIPYISEADIRFGLLKGELLIKLLAREIIIIDTNIDLLQFDDIHKQFLKNNGVAIGTEVGSSQITQELSTRIDSGGSGSLSVNFHENISLIGIKNSINRTFTTPHKFLNQNYQNSDWSIRVRHNGRSLDPNSEYEVLESGGAGTGFDTIFFISFTPAAFSQLLVDYVSLPV